MRIKQFLIAVGIGTMLAACSSRDDYSSTDDNVIRLSAGIQPLTTKAVGDNTINQRILSEGETTRVYIYDNVTSNKVSGLGSDGSIYTSQDPNAILKSTDSPLYPENGNGVNLTAVYPSSVTSTTSVFEVYFDQSDDNGYRNSDLLNAVVVNHKKSDGIAKLNYEHLLSKVIIKIDPGTSGLDVTQIRSASMYVAHRAVPLQYSQSEGWMLGTITEAETEKEVILANNTPYTNAGWAAIVPPQTIPVGYELLYFSLNDVAYHFLLETPLELLPKHVYTFTFTINNEKLNFMGHSISNWEEGTGDNFDIGPYWF